MTGSYNNFFRMFDRSSRKEVTYEASKEIAKPKTILKPRKVRYEFMKETESLYLSQNTVPALYSAKILGREGRTPPPLCPPASAIPGLFA